MPRDYPSQAQTGLAKGLEGLFSGITQGMQGAKDQELKKSYMDAMYSGKRDPLELENARQGNRMQLAALKAKNALDYLAKQGGKKAGANPRAVGVSAQEIAAIKNAAFKDSGATDIDNMDEEQARNYQTSLRASLRTIAEDRNRRNRMIYGRDLTPDEILDPDAMLSTMEVTTPEAPSTVFGIELPFGKTPARVGVVDPAKVAKTPPIGGGLTTEDGIVFKKKTK